VDFDSLCGTLLGTSVNCPVIINCQVKKYPSDELKFSMGQNNIAFFAH